LKIEVDILQRAIDYTEDHCWQYDIRKNNMLEDIKNSGLSQEEIDSLRVSDFEFRVVTDKAKQRDMINFITRHEWLGNISQFPTHWFGMYYKDILSGVIIMNMPNAFSKVIGEETKEVERLVSRGACISWSPKNLASAFLMKSVNWMVNNTQYRVFSAYSDPTAKELGSIYQACNWFYIGKNAGTTKRYINPYNGKLMSDRAFRARSFYKRYAKDLNIKWEKNWNTDHNIHWELMPEGVEKALKAKSKEVQANASFHVFPLKHKYICVLGRDKRETKALVKKFLDKTKVYDYPKIRGK
jgi:hypothetical protein